MSLTERERRCLADLALEIGREDPGLARMLTRGRWLPRRTRMRLSLVSFLSSRRWWQWSLAALVLGGLAAFLSTGLSPRPITDAIGAGIMLGAALLLAVVRLVAGHCRRSAPDG
jgi:hypothetical protein